MTYALAVAFLLLPLFALDVYLARTDSGEGKK